MSMTWPVTELSAWATPPTLSPASPRGRRHSHPVSLAGVAWPSRVRAGVLPSEPGAAELRSNVGEQADDAESLG
jgi:hypothetical protein